MAYAFRGRPTLKDVKRQLRNGSFRELNETKISSNVTEMDATIGSGTRQNTNSLISSGYLIENYSKDDSDKENNSTNKWTLYWNLLKTK